MWLKKLYTIFVSKDNFELILDTSVKQIYNKTGKNIEHNKNHDLFFETLNTIASQVFSIESKNPILQKQSPIEALHIINSIVIDELVNYILTKKPELLKEPEIVKEHINIQDNSKEMKVIEKNTELEEETLKISIENNKTKFNSPIENIISINIVSLHMYTQDYIITDTNNTLVIIDDNEKITIKIETGNYTQKTLFKVLEASIFDKMQKSIQFYISNTDNTVFTSPNIVISDVDSTLDDILGIVKGNPMKLIKRNKLQLGIKFGFENEINDFEISHPIIINSNNVENDTGPILKEFKLNYNKKFKHPVDLSEIKIDFDNYNHRGYPYYLILEIRKIA